MNIAVAISNGVTISASMFCMAHLYRFHWRGAKPRTLIASSVIIAVTFLVTALQFAYPEIVAAFRRNPEALRAGQWWRLVTPLFVQPYGWGQVLFNGIFLLVFLPLAERLYGNWLWFLYFAPGILGQIVNYWWQPNGGGSSTGAFGVMGSLLIHVIRVRRDMPKLHTFLAIAGVCGALGMCAIKDGHGPPLLLGAALALASRGASKGEHA